MKEINMKESKVTEALTQIDVLEDLSTKDKGCLRLLTEEMFSMVRELLGEDVMDFTVKRDQETYTLCVATKTQVNEEAREQFLSMSSNGKNAANKGVKGLLGSVLEVLSYGGDPALYGVMAPYGVKQLGGEQAYTWSLSHYLDLAPEQGVRDDWDGMEKSIIAKFADDVSIGVRSGKLKMIVTKTL